MSHTCLRRRGFWERPLVHYKMSFAGIKFFFSFLLLFKIFSRASSEYKLCAPLEEEALCKWIEASRNEVRCVRVSDAVDCLLKMQKNEADAGTFFAEEAFLAARFLGESGTVLAEVRHPDREENRFGFETVAVVRSDFFGGLSALKGSAYCHPGFSRAQYWSDRVLKDFESKVMDHFKDDIKCNGAARTAYEDDLFRLTKIFSKACRPGTWAVGDWWDKKLKREYHSLCEQCEHPSTCSYMMENKGRHSDALRCLTLRGGNVTYTALEFVRKYFEETSQNNFSEPHYKNPNRYSFLCKDGSTRPLTSSDSCSWIKQPWTSVVALNSIATEMLKNLKEWLEEGEKNDYKRPTWNDHLKNVLTKGNGVLKFRDRPTAVSDYIKEGRIIPNEEGEECRRPVRWCTIGATEKKKCQYISAAALAHGLPTRIVCVESTTKINCLEKISKQKADVVFIDSELGYVSRKVYNLTTAAYLETQRTGNYYGVVVVKGKSLKTFKSLKGKKACFPQYQGLGWMTFVQALKNLRIIPEKTCSHSKKVWNYFSRACAPGAKDPAWNVHFEKTPERLCQACDDTRLDGFCKADSSNNYFGEIGALKCLKEGVGDVAFLDFYSIQKYLEAKDRTRVDPDTNPEDFTILCKDGSLETFNLTNPDKCSFTQLNGGEVVTRKDLDPVERNDIFLTLMELDDLFGTAPRHYRPALKMFEPFDGKPDVLFKESAVSLASIFETRNSFVNNYVQLLDSLENCLAESGSFNLLPSVLVLVFLTLIIFFQL